MTKLRVCAAGYRKTRPHEVSSRALSGVRTFLNSPEDMAWLRDVHLPKLGPEYLSAAIYGNEDCPDQIECYESVSPNVNYPSLKEGAC